MTLYYNRQGINRPTRAENYHLSRYIDLVLQDNPEMPVEYVQDANFHNEYMDEIKAYIERVIDNHPEYFEGIPEKHHKGMRDGVVGYLRGDRKVIKNEEAVIAVLGVIYDHLTHHELQNGLNPGKMYSTKWFKQGIANSQEYQAQIY